jgi:hypothetical protein
MKISQKINCNRCRAVNKLGVCSLKFKTTVRGPGISDFKIRMIPLEPCPKPLTNWEFTKAPYRDELITTVMAAKERK